MLLASCHTALQCLSNPRLILIRKLPFAAPLFSFILLFLSFLLWFLPALPTVPYLVTLMHKCKAPYCLTTSTQLQSCILKMRLCPPLPILIASVSALRTAECCCLRSHPPSSETILLLYEAAQARLNLPKKSPFLYGPSIVMDPQNQLAKMLLNTLQKWIWFILMRGGF